MDLGKLRGTPEGDDPASQPEDDASRDLPANTRPGAGPRGGKNPKNITETKVWREGMGGFRQMWGNYLKILATSFSRMQREDQEVLITRLCQVITVGCAIVLTSFFYQFVPTLIRVFALPAFIVGSWFIATRVVSPIIITQFESKLNP